MNQTKRPTTPGYYWKFYAFDSALPEIVLIQTDSKGDFFFDDVETLWVYDDPCYDEYEITQIQRYYCKDYQHTYVGPIKPPDIKGEAK